MTAALRAEWRKITALPLPRVIAAAVVLVSAGAGAAALAAPSGTPGAAAANAQAGLAVAGMLGTIVFAVWMFGVEAREGTIARCLTAEARRARLVAAKGLLATLLPLAVLAVAGAIVLPLAAAAVAAHGGDANLGALARQVAGAVAQATLAAPLSFGLAVVTRSLAGGLVAALALLELTPGLFAIAGAEVLSPAIALQTLHDHVAGGDGGFALTAAADAGPVVVLVVVAAWSAAAVLTGTARLVARDVA